jgi:hypothetical protein
MVYLPFPPFLAKVRDMSKIPTNSQTRVEELNCPQLRSTGCALSKRTSDGAPLTFIQIGTREWADGTFETTPACQADTEHLIPSSSSHHRPMVRWPASCQVRGLGEF